MATMAQDLIKFLMTVKKETMQIKDVLATLDKKANPLVTKFCTAKLQALKMTHIGLSHILKKEEARQKRIEKHGEKKSGRPRKNSLTPANKYGYL